MEELYYDDIFHLHERGVDFVFVLLYLHILKKLYLKSYLSDSSISWKSGSILFLLTHGIIFFGLVLCCTHLSDITLKIAANIMQTFFFKYGNVSYILFTNHTITTDSLIRMMYIHYILAIAIWCLILIHLRMMHYTYRKDNYSIYLLYNNNWFSEIFFLEVIFIFLSFSIFITIYLFFYKDLNEPLSYEIFMWGDIGFVTEIRFLSVAPHWYFKAYMGWLLFCPHHYLGIFGLVSFMVIFYFHTELFNFIFNKLKNLYKVSLDLTSFWGLIFFWIFFLNLVYTLSYLPCGKYFTFVKGNEATTFAYIFIFFYWFLPIEFYVKLITYKKLFWFFSFLKKENNARE